MNEKSKSRAELLQLPHCEKVYDVEGVGEVTFPAGVNLVERDLDIEIDLEDLSEEEIQSIQEANQLAIQAIDESYDSAIAKQIKQNFASSLNWKGEKKLNLKLPFNIILSEDFFGVKISVLPNFSKLKFSYNAEKFFTDKLSAINFLKDHPVEPLREKTRALPLDTEKTKDEIVSLAKGASPEVIAKLEAANTAYEAVLLARENGLDLEETFQPLAEIEEKVKSEDAASSEILSPDDCAEPQTSISEFRGEEVNTVATQCCEPTVEEELDETIPEIEEPDLQTEEEILDFVQKIEDVSLQLQKCSQEKAYADGYILRIYQVREDLYPLTFYMKKRQELFEKYSQAISFREIIQKNVDESRALLVDIRKKALDVAKQALTNRTVNVAAFGVAIADAQASIIGIQKEDPWSFSSTGKNSQQRLQSAFNLLTGSSTVSKLGNLQEKYKASISTQVTAYQKNNDTISSLISSLSALENELGFKPTLSAAEKVALQKVGSNALAVFTPDKLLLPTRKLGEFNYTNQSGVKPKSKNKFFLLIDGEKKIFNELRTLYELNKFSPDLEVLYKPESNIDGTQELTGIINEKVWNKFNSVDRVDFLFTEKEQGYISPKPSNSDLQDPAKRESVAEVQIDQEKATEFMSNYDVNEEARLLEKIAEARKDAAQYFSRLEILAKQDASKIYEGQLLSVQWNRADLTKDFKDLREKYTKEFEAALKFEKELQKKVISLKEFSAAKKQCFVQQEEALNSLFPNNEKPQAVDAPCSDPFGVKPIKAKNPGPQKNCYWKEYTKNLQTVSFMPIPDILQLNKRLFRYYPVGLQIPVPVPPAVLPTLAMGIPDPMISIPFPILWKHIITLTTPAGQFVLWITFCPPFTVSPYLLFLDEEQNAAFLSSPKGKVTVPAPSLKWKKFLEKSLLERIPGMKIPMKSLPPVDSNVNNKKPDSTKTFLEDLRKKIKSQIDKIDSQENNLSAERIEKRTKLKDLREKLNKALDTNSPELPKIILDFVTEIKKQVAKKATDMIDFEPFTVPKTNLKKAGSDTKNDTESLKDKIKALKKAGAKIKISTVNVGEIIKRESLAILDTPEGKELIKQMDKEIQALEDRLARTGVNKDVNLVSKERAKVITKFLKKVLEKSVKKITPKKLGWVEDPLTLIPVFLPFPCKSNIAVEPIPPWMMLVIAGVAGLSSLLDSPNVEEKFEKSFSLRINLKTRLPRSKDLLTQAISSGLDIVLQLAGNAIPVPGWPNAIPYPKAVSPLKQIIKEAKNAVFKKKLRLPPVPPGVPPIPITPEAVKKVAVPIIGAAVDLTFAIILEELLSYADKKSEQLDPQTINKIKNSLALVKAILGTDLWDIREQDIKSAASAYAKNALLSAENAIKTVMAVADAAPVKQLKSIFSKLTMKPEIKLKTKEPSIDIGQEIAFALFKAFLIGYVTGSKKPPPYPLVLLGASTGLPGWLFSTLVNPLSAVEKTPPWERLCLKNVPYVIFLDLLAASAQRYGGIGNSYITPYFTPEP